MILNSFDVLYFVVFWCHHCTREVPHLWRFCRCIKWVWCDVIDASKSRNLVTSGVMHSDSCNAAVEPLRLCSISCFKSECAIGWNHTTCSFGSRGSHWNALKPHLTAEMGMRKGGDATDLGVHWDWSEVTWPVKVSFAQRDGKTVMHSFPSFLIDHCILLVWYFFWKAQARWSKCPKQVHQIFILPKIKKSFIPNAAQGLRKSYAIPLQRILQWSCTPLVPLALPKAGAVLDTDECLWFVSMSKFTNLQTFSRRDNLRNFQVQISDLQQDYGDSVKPGYFDTSLRCHPDTCQPHRHFCRCRLLLWWHRLRRGPSGRHP